VSGSPALHSRWLLLLKIEISHRTIPARFNLIWFSGFRGENLNVIFYQNMLNLHNRYKSAERKIHRKTLNKYSTTPCQAQILTAATWQGVV
jgi:hypothetical protein